MVEPDGLEVLAPAPVQKTMGWPELARLGFGAERSHGAIPIGLEGDWLERFGTLLGDEGRWSERQVMPAAPFRRRATRSGVLDRALDLPNAVWRFRGMTATCTRCLMLAFRYTAVSDEKREGLIWLGFNLGTGAVISDILRVCGRRWRRCRLAGARSGDQARGRAGMERGDARGALRPLLDRQVRDASSRSCAPCAAGSSATATVCMPITTTCAARPLKRLAALARGRRRSGGGRSAARDAAGRGDRARIPAKLDDLRHNYALRVAVEWVQALELYVPVQRFDVLIRRRKGERVVQLDWHPLVKTAEPPLCEAGLGARSGPPRLRRQAAPDRTRRPGALPVLRQALLSRLLPGGLSALQGDGAQVISPIEVIIFDNYNGIYETQCSHATAR